MPQKTSKASVSKPMFKVYILKTGYEYIVQFIDIIIKNLPGHVVFNKCL